MRIGRYMASRDGLGGSTEVDGVWDEAVFSIHRVRVYEGRNILVHFDPVLSSEVSTKLPNRLSSNELVVCSLFIIVHHEFGHWPLLML